VRGNRRETMNVNPYLTFSGKCEEAFRFYERCFGGKIEGMMKFAGSPMAQHVPAEWGDKVMHASLHVGDSRILGTDPPPDRYQEPRGMSVALNVKEPEEAERVFDELSKDGKIQMPIQKTFWSARFGMVTDRFGIAWMVNCEQAA
jgi:PhnB protein